MSKAKDRARAESGLIFRNGHLVSREDWYKANPTREMRLARQAKVDEGVEQVKANLLRKPTPEETKAAGTPPFVPNRYYCTACRRHHTQDSKVGKEHINFYLEEA